MNHNNLYRGRERIGADNFYSVIEPSSYQTVETAARLQQETDARIAGRMALGMTFFALGGGANLMPLTEAVAVEATIGVTEIADNHKTASTLGSTAVTGSNKSR